MEIHLDRDGDRTCASYVRPENGLFFKASLNCTDRASQPAKLVDTRMVNKLMILTTSTDRQDRRFRPRSPLKRVGSFFSPSSMIGTAMQDHHVPEESDRGYKDVHRLLNVLTPSIYQSP